MVLAEDDGVGADPPRGVDDRTPRLAGGPHQVRVEARLGQPLARLAQVRDDVRRRREGRALVRRDVVQRPEVARPLRVERQLLDADDGDPRRRVARLRDGAVEGAATAVRAVVPDEDPPRQL